MTHDIGTGSARKRKNQGTSGDPPIGELIATFVGHNTSYYADKFERMRQQGPTGLSFNWAATLGGPIWTGARRLWWLFWCVTIGDVLGLTIAARAVWGETFDDSPGTDIKSLGLIAGLVLLIACRVLTGVFANTAYYRGFIRWRGDRSLAKGISFGEGAVGLLVMLFLYPLTVYRFSAPQVASPIRQFPTTRFIKHQTAAAMDHIVDWMTINLETFFDSITIGIRTVLNFLELVFVTTPWPVTFFVIVFIAWRVGGWRVGLFSGLSLLYIGIFGFWEKAMSTFSLVGAAVFLCIGLGGPLGICCAKNSRLYTFIRPILDVMQTLPSFVYLIPAVAFFSIGKPPGILATLVFALPPMIRLTALGIMQVPNSVREAAVAFGATPAQLLWKVELPLAIPSIMTGINQSTMLSLSMVVVAALIGAGGLGYDVLFALQHVETGNGVLAGLAIALLAMVLDRIIQGSQEKAQTLRL